MRRPTPLIGMALVAACWAPGLCPAADSLPRITEADLERAARLKPLITERDLERARRHARTPSAAELARVPVPAMPALDRLAQPVSPGTLDLQALARGYEVNADRMSAFETARTGAPSLLVFVSFSLPPATLNRLVEQAERAAATLVLRGLTQGSLKETVLRVRKLIGTRQVAFQIDPQAFERFGIVHTPTFVLVRPGAQARPCNDGQCLPAGSFVCASGDVSLDYALEFIERSAPAFGNEARGFLRRLRG
jgi:conjugal transfer pilus assembly protein TrbC